MTPERQLDILIATRSLISHPSQWGKGRFISSITFVDRLLRRRQRMCLVGAVSVAATGHTPADSASTMWTAEVHEVTSYLATLIPADDPNRSAYGLGMMTWNDRHTWNEVISLVDLGILETRYQLSAAEDHKHESDDRQDDQDRPKHDTPIPG